MTGQTGRAILQLAGVAGWPVHHSLSPLIHNHWLSVLRRQGRVLNGAYTMFAVRPDEAVRAFRSLPRTSILGLNVTLPLKAEAFEAADQHTPDALKLGVCNLLYKKDGILVGHNTDMEGFAIPLLEKIGHQTLMNTSCTLVGTGGAARAVLGALLELGAPEIILLGRDNAKARELVTRINTPNLQTCDWQNRHDALRHSGLVINATSAGMKGQPALDIDIRHMKVGGWVYDLVYTPALTPLITQAKRVGLKTIGGLEMLIAQAKPSFKVFYDSEPPDKTGLRPLLTTHLEKNQ